MPSLVLDIPASLYDRLEHLAKLRQRTPADIALEVLDVALPPTPAGSDSPADEVVVSPRGGTAYRTLMAIRCDPPLPSAPFTTEELCAPFDIPWHEGEPVVPIGVAKDIPEPHDLDGLE